MDSLRQCRKEQLSQLACRVQSEYGFRLAVKDTDQKGVDYMSGSSQIDEYVTLRLARPLLVNSCIVCLQRRDYSGGLNTVDHPPILL